MDLDLSDDLAIYIGNAIADEVSHSESLREFKQIINEGEFELAEPAWIDILKHHQAQAVAAMTIKGLRGVCLFDEQGVGKTLTTVAAFDVLRKSGDIDVMVVVAPKTLVTTWAKEFEDFLPERYSVIGIEGSKLTRLRAIQTNSDVYITTFDIAAMDAQLLKTLFKTRKVLLTVDESFLAKNPETKRSQGLTRLRQDAVKAFVLCGTPAPNRPSDVINQVDLADGGYAFRTFSTTGSESLDANTIAKILEDRAPIIRRTKNEVLPELPTKNFNVIQVQMTSTQQSLYEDARTELVLYLKRLDNQTFKRDLVTYFKKRAALLQICVSPSLVGHHEIDSGKYQSLVELVSKLINEEQNKVVIWSAYTKSTNQIVDLLSEFGTVRLDGTIKDPGLRQKAIEKFQSDPNTRIFIGNPAAAGAGITLTAARAAIYVSLSNQAAHFMQSIDRIHRIGQLAESVDYYFLSSSGTIEESELDRIFVKQTTQSNLLGDSAKQDFSLEGALDELGENV
jgi:SNF2 family DNA or RNA helicase